MTTKTPNNKITTRKTIPKQRLHSHKHIRKMAMKDRVEIQLGVVLVRIIHRPQNPTKDYDLYRAAKRKKLTQHA